MFLKLTVTQDVLASQPPLLDYEPDSLPFPSRPRSDVPVDGLSLPHF